MFSSIKAVLFLFLACTSALAMGQSDHAMQLPEMEAIAEQRIALAEEKKSHLGSLSSSIQSVLEAICGQRLFVQSQATKVPSFIALGST